MRLCFVVESGTDVRLVNGLAERFDLTVLGRQIPTGFPVNHAPEDGSEIIVGPASRGSFARLVWARLVSRPRFDVVLVQGYALAALAANLASRVGGVPTFMLICSPIERYYRCRQHDDSSTSKRYRPWEYWGLKALARLNGRVGRRYVVLSRHLADVVRSHGTRARVDIVPVYGVDTRVFHPAPDSPATIRQRIGLAAGHPLIFYSSRVAPEKDSDTLLLAFRTLLAQGRRIHLLHRSGGYRQFAELAERHGVSEFVTAREPRHPLRGLALDYQASDVCVQASREEGLGFSPLEAMACGVPVVATAVGGLCETVVEGVTGWTYPVGDAMALADRISTALDNPGEARRRAAAGRRLVIEHYERGEVFNRLELLLKGSPISSNARDSE
jgi:glycosyltransferase involved in cell wall biosynthesis